MSSERPSFTDTRFDEPGTLPKPGPIGRVVRFLLGVMCAYPVFSFWIYPQALVRSGAPHWSAWIAIALSIYLIP